MALSSYCSLPVCAAKMLRLITSPDGFINMCSIALVIFGTSRKNDLKCFFVLGLGFCNLLCEISNMHLQCIHFHSVYTCMHTCLRMRVCFLCISMCKARIYSYIQCCFDAEVKMVAQTSWVTFLLTSKYLCIII